MTEASWSAAGVVVRPWIASDRAGGLCVRATGVGRVSDELARSLASWLLWWAGSCPSPAEPDLVRLAVDEARAALRERSAAAETTEDFRAGLAWCEHHLAAIAEAAES